MPFHKFCNDYSARIYHRNKIAPYDWWQHFLFFMKCLWYPDNIGLIGKTTRMYLSTLILEKMDFGLRTKKKRFHSYFMNHIQHYNIILSHLLLGVFWIIKQISEWYKIMLDQADIISFFFISWVAEVHSSLITWLFTKQNCTVANLCFQSSQRWHVAPSYCVAAYSLEEASSSWYRDFSFSFTQAPSVRSHRPFVRGPFLQPPTPSPWSRRRRRRHHRHLALL